MNQSKKETKDDGAVVEKAERQDRVPSIFPLVEAKDTKHDRTHSDHGWDFSAVPAVGSIVRQSDWNEYKSVSERHEKDAENVGLPVDFARNLLHVAAFPWRDYSFEVTSLTGSSLGPS